MSREIDSSDLSLLGYEDLVYLFQRDRISPEEFAKWTKDETSPEEDDEVEDEEDED